MNREDINKVKEIMESAMSAVKGSTKCCCK